MKDDLLYRVLKNRPTAVMVGLVASLLVFSATFLFSFKNSYQSYWQAIYRVQTVDFNMVAHAFPALVREHIVSNDSESLKELLNSNYSVFAMAVDVCVDPQCSAYKEWVTNDGHSRSDLFDIPVFKSEKAPVTIRFEHTYSEKPLVTAADDQDLLGRLRLYRVESPTLTDEIRMFARRAFSGEASASRYIAYFSDLYSSLFLSISFFLFFVLLRNYYLEKRLRRRIAMLLRMGVMKKYA